MKKLGAFIKTVRQKRGITQKQLARKLNCHPQQIFNWESGRTIVPMKYAPKLAAALHMPEEKLINYLVRVNTQRLLKKMGRKK